MYYEAACCPCVTSLGNKQPLLLSATRTAEQPDNRTTAAEPPNTRTAEQPKNRNPCTSTVADVAKHLDNRNTTDHTNGLGPSSYTDHCKTKRQTLVQRVLEENLHAFLLTENIHTQENYSFECFFTLVCSCWLFVDG
jgi:hypothetical protein